MTGEPIGFGPEFKISEEVLQNIFLEAGDGIFLIDAQGVMLEMNPRGCEILGYPREELLGQPVMKFHPPDEVAHILEKLALLATEKLVTAESAFIRKDGARVPVEITGKLLSNNQIIGMLRDISERKQTEQALIESEQKFRTLVEYSPDGIVLVDEQGLVVEWNRGQERLTGLGRGEAVGNPIWDVQLRLMGEELRTDAVRERLKSLVLGLLHGGNVPEANQVNEAVFSQPDGSTRNVEIMVFTYKSVSGYRMGSIIRDITRRKQVDMLLEYLALHDGLTDLPNRQLFQDRLELAVDRAVREKRGTLAVMMLDLDHFKQINDQFGHAFGDQLLKVAAQRLRECLRKSDTAARIGGDEFALINEEVTDPHSCELIAEKVLESLSSPIEIEGHSFVTTASIGISLFMSGSDDSSTLLRQADIAMYNAKRSRNCYRFYAPHL